MVDYARPFTSEEHVSDSVNLLISILIRYPEIGTIKYLPETNSLKMTFLLRVLPDTEDLADVCRVLEASICAYHLLKGLKNARVALKVSHYDPVMMLEVQRDVPTLSQNEIALMIHILNESYGQWLIADYHETMPEDDLIVQEEYIADMLENIKRQRIDQGLIGIREDGRVFVFDK
ncbi:MAG TPA: hypothetical protein VN611_12850 [Patescibacteria group bacterium]|nr:hypothetical protein [Patescibacteria group bacterium]